MPAYTLSRRSRAIAALALCAPLLAAQAQQGAAPPDWCKSKWGPSDEIGAANLLTPALAVRAARLATTGKTYALGVETNSNTPAYGSRSFHIVVNQPGQAGGAGLGPNLGTYNDDVIMGYVGIGSQLDGLGHLGVDNVYYNCNRARDFVQADGLRKLGIEKVPPIVTRGVLLDMTAHYGTDPVAGGTAFNRAEIEAQAQRQGVEVGTGDVVIFHTGWLDKYGADRARYLAAEPGVGYEGAEYLVSKGVVAVGADNWGVEVSPADKAHGDMAVHQLLLAKSGVYILETMNTGPLARDRVSEFMFVLGPARITGAVQAIINPIAIR
jgi:kynurenine formamidase